MAKIFQGFELIKNIEENLLDRTALNNLGTSPVGDDINLFHNNLRNISYINVTSTNISGDLINLPLRSVVFSNRTKLGLATFSGGTDYYVNAIIYLSDGSIVTVKQVTNGVVTDFDLILGINTTIFDEKTLTDETPIATRSGTGFTLTLTGKTFYVKNSDNIGNFQITENSNLNGIATPIAGLYIRSDTIELNNFKNFSPERRPNNSAAGINQGVIIPAYYPIVTSVNQMIKSYEDRINFFKIIKRKSIVQNNDFTTNTAMNSTGAVVIKNPDLNNIDSNMSGPGLFIYNPDDGQKIRAFSSTTNVWDNKTAGYLETTSRKIKVGELFMNPPSGNLVFEQKSGSTLLVTSANTDINSDNFNYKLPVTINGSIYYLCISKTP